MLVVGMSVRKGALQFDKMKMGFGLSSYSDRMGDSTCGNEIPRVVMEQVTSSL